MNDRTLVTLELLDFLELVAGRTQTPLGRRRILQLRPSVVVDVVRRELELTSECVAWLSRKGRFGLAGVQDLSGPTERLHIEGTVLESLEIIAFERLLLVGGELKKVILGTEPTEQLPRLREVTMRIPDTRPILDAIQGKILPDGEIDDNASLELREIRKDLTERRHRINRTLEAMIRESPQTIQDEIITFRNGRFVIPIRTDSRHQIPGVMHGLSSSGQTTYVEPMSVINQNNDLVRLREQEDHEIARILFTLTEVLRRNRDAVLGTLDAVVELDAVQARALTAVEFDCSPPRISETGAYILTDARHIILENKLRKTGGGAVPISFELDGERRALVISGPNAGGKTVALKTAGMASLMMQMGFHVPAREALLPVFGQVFADIGDQQSIASNLSTFTAHMRNIAEMFAELQCPALILLDEVGAGTDPDEGAAMAIAVIDAFRRAGAVTLASTHYPRLKMWAAQIDGVRSASVEFDERTLCPTYRLLLDIAGASAGIEIARRMNVPEDILTAAAALVEPDHAAAREYLKRLREIVQDEEQLRSALFEERRALAEKYASLDEQYAEREAARKTEFEVELERVVGEFKKESDRAVGKIKDRIEAARVRRTAGNMAAELHRQSARLQQDATTPVASTAGAESERSPVISSDDGAAIDMGDVVRVVSLDREGVVEGIQDETFTVAIGAIRYRADRSDLVKIKDRKNPIAVPAVRGVMIAPDDPESEPELKVIGLTADETIEKVDRFLDQAFLAGAESVRIIHGYGKGILRSAIARFLEHHAQVDRFTVEGGATVVFLKGD